MTPTERLEAIHKKLNWSKKHFRDLAGEIGRFVNDPSAHQVGTKTDPNTGETIYYVSSLGVVPAPINLLVGDVLHNCRATLDHFAYQLVLVNGGSPTKKTCFPVFDDSTKYVAQRGVAVQGMRKDAIDYIDGTKPYKTGNTVLWQLHRLNNIDKHRVLVTTVASYGGRSIQERDWQLIRSMFSGELPRELDKIQFVGNAGGEWIPLKQGHEFHRTPAGDEVDKGMRLSVDVMFDEPDIIDGYPVLHTLDKMINFVYAVTYNLDVLR